MFSLILAVLGVLASPQAQAKLNVVATTPDLASIAQEIGGNEIELTTLAKPSEDPHFVDPKPSFIVKLNRADVLIEGWAELEIGWLPSLLSGARNSKIAPGAPGHVRANEGIQMLQVPSALDRSKGDLHAAGNPHYLVDPVAGEVVAKHITEVFCRLDAKAADKFRGNLKNFLDRLNTSLAKWKATMAPFQGQTVVGYHDSWPYFAERFGLKIDIFLEPKPGIPPTPAHLASVIMEMKARKAHVIIVDNYQDIRTAQTVAARTDATVVEVTHFPGGVKGTDGGYIQLIDYLVNSISKALAAKT